MQNLVDINEQTRAICLISLEFWINTLSLPCVPRFEPEEEFA